MKKILMIIIFAVLTLTYIFSVKSKIRFYGNFESTFDITHKREYDSQVDADENEKVNPYGYFSWGWNNYANLRMKAIIGEYVTFDLALNLEMLSGNYTETYESYADQALQFLLSPASADLATSNFFSIPFYYKNTYVGSFSLERMYFQAGNQFFDIEAGLIRIARGYGYSFSPLDLFNPKDPISPDKRPEGKLAFVSSFYPLSMWKIETFVIAPDNPVEQKGWGFKIGAATQFNIDRFNFEILYSLFLPDIEFEKDPLELNLPEYANNDFVQIAGFSFKADIEIGLFVDLIYRFEHRAFKEKAYYGEEFYAYKGLEAAIGIDYTIPVPNTPGSIYLLLEYQFYGSGMIDWWEDDLDELYIQDEWYKFDTTSRSAYFNTEAKPQNFLRHDYIFGMIQFTINTYVTVSTSYLFGIDDQSGLFSWSVDIEPFQAFIISIDATYPIGWEIINNTWNPGEFGSTNVGFFQKYRISVNIKF